MPRIISSEPALSDLGAIADYIALDDPNAASTLVKKIFAYVNQLSDHLQSGSRPPELMPSRYRQILEPPCRIFYRFDGQKIFILHMMRSERLLRRYLLSSREKRFENE